VGNFQGIADRWPPAGSALPSAILNTMADLEREELAFLGLKQSYGTNIPKTLTGPWPVILHIPGAGSTLEPFSFGGSGMQQPGGKKAFTFAVDWYLIVGTVNDDLGAMITLAVDLAIALDTLYARNKGLGGLVHEVKLNTPAWEQFPYGRDSQNAPIHYYAHVMRGTALCYYQQAAHQ
jgi:hypothetical protein